jgi:hypothetical protein
LWASKLLKNSATTAIPLLSGLCYDERMKPLLLTVGNIYIDHNIFGVSSGQEAFSLEAGKDYFGSGSERVLGGSLLVRQGEMRVVSKLGRYWTERGY